MSNRRTVAWFVALLAGIAAVCGPAAAQTEPVSGNVPIRVGIKPLDPFVVRNGDDYSGFSIDVWQEIARYNGWQTRYVWNDTLPPVLAAVQAGQLDAGIAGISITKDRESVIDFSYPMFNAGLQVMAGAGHKATWADGLKSLGSGSVVKYLLALLAAMFVAGNVVYLVTRGHADEPSTYIRGVGHGMFRVAAVGLAGDIGSAEARRAFGRFMAIAWLIVGVVFISLFAATITTHLTIESITTDIRGVSDLPGKRVATVKGSTAASFLTNRSITFVGVESIDDAYPLLDRGEVDAIVFDAPVLRHHLAVAGSSNQTLVGAVFQREDYGIALPTGSALRKPINQALLAMRADGTYDRLYEKYFGAVTS
ncbi:MAG: transporter substrate-binding domain-containing protein [Acidimicrobiia bacterium]